MAKSYDFIIIGGGSAGLVAADFAARLGLRVCIVEKSHIGGDCTWTGCVPSKALLKAAKVAHTARTGRQFGIEISGSRTDMVQVCDYIRRSINEVYKNETPEILSDKGVDVIFGEAQFVNDRQIQVGGSILSAKKFLIATGAGPYIPAITGLESVKYYTYENIFDNDVLPEELIVIGAGPAGVELAQAYRRLGSEVTIVDQELLPTYDSEASQILHSVFRREGIKFMPGLCLSVENQREKVVIHTGDNDAVGDMLLIVAGRKPKLSRMGLDDAGILFDDDGIEVNKYLRTNKSHIYAAGDVTGGAQFTHIAGWQGFAAARNALLPGNLNAKNHVVASAIFTDPEIAQAGLTEEEARRKYGSKIEVKRASVEQSDRALIDNSPDYFSKIVHKSDGTILGAAVVSERAGETINEYVIAMENKIKVKDLGMALHVYPSYGMDTMRMAAEIAAARLHKGMPGTLVRQLAQRYA